MQRRRKGTGHGGMTDGETGTGRERERGRHTPKQREREERERLKREMSKIEAYPIGRLDVEEDGVILSVNIHPLVH